VLWFLVIGVCHLLGKSLFLHCSKTIDMLLMIIGTNSAQEIVEFAPSPLSCDCGFSNHSKASSSLLSGKNRTNICIYVPQC
jgi:hypothetical protein